MIAALFYLQFHSWRNRLAARLRRLKKPKYLIGGIIGGLYLASYFYTITFSSGNSPDPGQPLPDPALAQNIGALLLLAIALVGWVLPNERAALIFSEAEINFLFPAPLTRPQLINYKLISSQTRILISVLFLTLVWGRWRQGGHVWVSALGWWTILSFLELHGLAASFIRTMLLDRGITHLRRRLLILTALVVTLGSVYYWSRSEWPPFPSGGKLEGMLDWLKHVLSLGAAPYVLYPFRAVVGPYFAADALGFLYAWVPALVILGSLYYLVIRANVAFEEASVEASQQLAATVATAQARRAGAVVAPAKAKRAPFNLKPLGLPAVAFLWKNLILAGNFFSLRNFWRAALVLVVWGIIFRPTTAGGVITVTGFAGAFCIIILFLSLLVGPMLLRADFRSDLNMAEQLLSYPLPGWQIVLGEILTPVAILTAFQWLLILCSALFTPNPHGDILSLSHRVCLAATAAILAPAVNAVMLLIPNAVAILFPSWVRFDKNAPRGFENLGQNFIIAIGVLFIMAVAILPAVGCFFITFLLIGLLLKNFLAIFAAGVVASAVLFGESYLAIRLLGKSLEKFDLTSEITN